MNSISYKQSGSSDRSRYAGINLLYIVSFASFFMPANYAVPSSVLSVWEYTVCLVSIVAIVLYLRSDKIRLRWVLTTIGACTYYIVSTVLSGSDGSMQSAVFCTARVVGFTTLLEHGLAHNREATIRNFIIGGSIICFIHYITFLQYRHLPGGMRNGDLTRIIEGADTVMWFFLKHDNASAFCFLPVLTAYWYRACEYGEGYRSAIVFSIATLYMYWWLWSVTAMLTLTVYVLICFYLYHKDDNSVLIRYKHIVTAGLILCALVVILSTTDLAETVSSYFGKRAVFGGRKDLWERSLKYINGHVGFGAGYESDLSAVVSIGKNHCHNLILQLLYTGGLFSFVPIVASYYLYDSEESTAAIHYSRAQMCLIASVFAYFLLAAFDWYFHISVQVFAIILFAYSGSQCDASE